MSRGTICEWVLSEYGEKITEAVKSTAESGIEHGFEIVGWPNDHEAPELVAGEESSIDVISGTTTAFRPVRVTVHTHPSRSVVLSVADWENFLMQKGLYGPEKTFPDGWRRGIIVAARLIDDDPDEYHVRGVELTEKAVPLPPEQQYDWVQDALSGPYPPETDHISVCTRSVRYQNDPP